MITDAANKSLFAGTATIPLAVQPQVTMVTSMGTMVLELNPAKAPITVDNFLNYAESGFYVNKIFHRVIKSTSFSMIQGGGFTADMVQAPTQPAIKLEATNGLSNIRGSIAMARLGTPVDSATSQFFINSVNNTGFDATPTNAGYAVFGQIVTGLDVLDKIQVVATGTRLVGTTPVTDIPTTNILISSMLQTK
ncbi:MAG: peptidylprolyl isomerase [Undibacterium sp.]|nr:peptidylprolyl isomerase [Undibacterium sp.]